MKIVADGFSFDFTDALDVFVFDEKDRAKPTYHGVPMKAVDLVVELPTAYLFVEMKDFADPARCREEFAEDGVTTGGSHDHFKWLKGYLKYKYRDTYLFRHAEQKVDKPIHYICLLTFENALNIKMQEALTRELPVGLASRRWKRKIAESCHVVNVAKWNQNFPRWPVMLTSESEEP